MKRVAKAATFMLCAGALVLLVAGNAAAQKGAPSAPKCTPDVPLEVTIVPITDGVLFADNKGVYKDGVDGVSNTVIRRCSGSNDATMSLGTSRRSVGFDFSDAAGSISYTNWPTWARNPDGTYAQFATKPFLNVRNILWGRNGGVSPVDNRYTFQTRLSIGYIKGLGDKSDYVLRFMPDGLAVPYPNPLQVPPADVNEPNDTVPVTVVDDGACTWTVTVDAPYVATLYKTTTETHAGQFYMPFQLQLKAKTCPF